MRNLLLEYSLGTSTSTRNIHHFQPQYIMGSLHTIAFVAVLCCRNFPQPELNGDIPLSPLCFLACNRKGPDSCIMLAYSVPLH